MDGSVPSARSPRPLILAGFATAGLVAAIAEATLLPNLWAVPVYLGLTLATTIVVAASVGLTRSGLRARLPRPLRIGSTLAVAGLSLTTLFALVVLPYLGGGSVRRDAPVTFASAVPTTSSAVPSSAPGSSPVPALAAAAAPLTGPFNQGPGVDTVSGTATLGRTADGAPVLRLSGLDATPGPDLYVYLVRAESPTGGQVTAGVLVAPLKVYKGDFTFKLDSTLDPAEFRSVGIYCRAFNIVFGYANLK